MSQGKSHLLDAFIKTINPRYFRIPLITGIIGFIVYITLNLSHKSPYALSVSVLHASAAAMGFAVMYWHISLFRCHSLIPPAFTRTTPYKAVGYLFIPFFNIYWIFPAVRGFAENVDVFLVLNKLPEQKIDRKLSGAVCVLYVLTFAFTLVFIFSLNEMVLLLSFLSGLSLFILMDKLIRQWASLQVFLHENSSSLKVYAAAEEGETAAGIKLKKAVMAAAMACAILFSMFFLEMLVTFPFTAFTTYRVRGLDVQLRGDLNNAYVAALAYLKDHPGSTITSEAQLIGYGWKLSPNVKFVRANLNKTTGDIVLKHESIAHATKGYEPGEGRVTADGSITTPRIR